MNGEVIIMYGVTLKVSSVLGSCKYIINSLYTKELKLGKVAVGTNLKFDRRKTVGLEKVLFHFLDVEKNKYVFVISDVVGYKFSDEKVTPNEYRDYICDFEKLEPKRSWFLIKNMFVCSDELVKSFITSEGVPIIDIINTNPKVNKIFFNGSISSDDLAILV